MHRYISFKILAGSSEVASSRSVWALSWELMPEFVMACCDATLTGDIPEYLFRLSWASQAYFFFGRGWTILDLLNTQGGFFKIFRLYWKMNVFVGVSIHNFMFVRKKYHSLIFRFRGNLYKADKRRITILDHTVYQDLDYD